MSETFEEDYQHCYHCWVSEEETGKFNDFSDLFGHEPICCGCADIESRIMTLKHLYKTIVYREPMGSGRIAEDLQGLELQIKNHLEDLGIDDSILTVAQVINKD